MAISSGLGNGIWRFNHFLPILFKVVGALLALMMLVSLVIYGISVYYESRVVKLGSETRNLQEDNQDLQLRLDRLRSYQKVAEASSKIQGLHNAANIIDVAEKKRVLAVDDKPPITRLPEDFYGY